MTKYLIILFVLLAPLLVQGQVISKKDLLNTNWFTDNKDSLFFKSDTIKITKYSNLGPDWTDNEYAESEQEYLGHGIYIELGFNKGFKLNYSEIYYSSSMIDICSKYYWDYKKDFILRIFKNKELICSLKPISINEVEVESKFAENQDLLKTKELTLIRIK